MILRKIEYYCFDKSDFGRLYYREGLGQGNGYGNNRNRHSGVTDCEEKGLWLLAS